MLAVVVVLPIIPVIAAVSTGGFSVPRFPPNTCLASNFNATFYGFVLLAIIILGAGVCLVILVLWRLSYLLMGRRLARRKTEVELRVSRMSGFHTGFMLGGGGGDTLIVNVCKTEIVQIMPF